MSGLGHAGAVAAFIVSIAESMNGNPAEATYFLLLAAVLRWIAIDVEKS